MWRDWRRNAYREVAAVAVRAATPADLRAVVEIARQCFREREDRFGAAWLVKYLAQPGVACLVEDAAITQVRGFLLTEHYGGTTVVRTIAVSPEARREGIGRLLLSSVNAPAWTWIRTENEASRGLFEAMGWREVDPPRKRAAWTYYRLG